ncbi:MAG: hypothetical protein ABII76_23820 [Pseudomonadota bacterium]
MAKREIKDPQMKALLMEVAATKLILRALIESALPEDQAEAWEEIEGLVGRIESIAKASVISGMESQSSQLMMKVATETASAFVRAIGPKPKKQ